MRSEHHVQDIQVNNDKPTQRKKKIKLIKEKQQKEKAPLGKSRSIKRTNKLKEQLDEWKKNISTKMDKLKKKEL